MSGAYDGPQIVGMDLHRRRSVLVRMTADGRKLETTRITNSPAELRKVIARAGKRPRVVLEATYGWYQSADTLAAAGAQVHLAHPLGVMAFSYRRVKNEEKDAADLADLLRMGRLPQGWIAPAEIRELRELTRYRIKLVRLRTSCKDQVHAVLAKLGLQVSCPVLAAVLVAEIGDITRFADPPRLCSQSGLTPRHRESDAKVTRGHITKQGSPLVRWALVEAIQHVPAGHPLRQRKEDILARRGDQAKNIAKVAAARQLLTWVFYAMRDGQVRVLAPPAPKAA